MKSYRKHIGLACVAALGLSLSACGGGGSTASTGGIANTVGVVQLAGVVVDGYLKGATAFVDRNNNGQLDVGEPKSTTDIKGAFLLTGLKAGDENYPIVVDIPATAIDSDTNKAVGKHSVMNAPAPGKLTGVVISPITTMIKTVMDNTAGADKYTAAAQVKKKLNLSVGNTVDLFSDYVAAKTGVNNTADYAKIHKIAQVVARAVANQVDTVKIAAAKSNSTASLSDVVSLITAQVVNQLAAIDKKITQTGGAWTPAQADSIAINDTVPLDTYSASFTVAVQKQIAATQAAAKTAQAAADFANATAQAALAQAKIILAQAQQLQDQYAASVSTYTYILANSAAKKVAANSNATLTQQAAATAAVAADPYATGVAKAKAKSAANVVAATQAITIGGTVAQGNAAMNAGQPANARALFAGAQLSAPNDLSAALGVCKSTFAQVASDPALRSLLTKFTTDAGATLPTPAQISVQMLGGAATAPVNWAKTSAQLLKTSVNATLLQDPAFDTVIVQATVCIHALKGIKASNFTSQVITSGASSKTWDRADLNATLAVAYQVRGGINWARSYNWSTDVDADGIPDTQSVSFVNPVDKYTYQYRTVNIAPVKVLNDPTFFTLAGGGSTLLVSSVNDFYSWANAQTAFLNDMYANPARAMSQFNAFNYAPNGFVDRIKLNNDLKSTRNVAAAFSASGYLATQQTTKTNTITSGVISGQNLTALTRAAFPKFSYDVAPKVNLSKQYDNPVFALTGNSWSPTVTSNILVDRSYDTTVAGILGAGMTVDLFDNIRRPLATTLLTDSYGKALTFYNGGNTHLVTDGVTHVLLTNNWAANVSICTLNMTTGKCSASLNVQGVTNALGASMVKGKLRIGSSGAGATYVVSPATGVVIQTIPWTGLPVFNGTVSFTSDGVNDYVFVSNWGQNPTTFNWGYWTTMYQAPVATGNFGAPQQLPVRVRDPSVSAGVVYGLPAWGFGSNSQLIKIDSATLVKKVADWPYMTNKLLAPVVVGGKVFDISNSTLSEYALPANNEFR